MYRYALLGLAALGLLGCAATQPPLSSAAPASAPAPTDIMLLGCPHFSQLYSAKSPATDVLTPTRQAELAAVRQQVARFRPTAIMVEVLPEQQAHLDSLYQRYRLGQLPLETLPDGRSEVYQLAFALARQLGHEHVYCVNAPGGTSQSILHQGTNIELYEQATQEHRAAQKPTIEQFQQGSLSMMGLLAFLNSAALQQQLHTLVYRTPARVTNGTLRPDAMVDSAFINPRYVGAEFISVFFNRDLKIYSNIVTTQLATRSPRVLTIIGGRHVASLRNIFRTDPAYRVVEASRYLKGK